MPITPNMIFAGVAVIMVFVGVVTPWIARLLWGRIPNDLEGPDDAAKL